MGEQIQSAKLPARPHIEAESNQERKAYNTINGINGLQMSKRNDD